MNSSDFVSFQKTTPSQNNMDNLTLNQTGLRFIIRKLTIEESSFLSGAYQNCLVMKVNPVRIVKIPLSLFIFGLNLDNSTFKNMQHTSLNDSKYNHFCEYLISKAVDDLFDYYHDKKSMDYLIVRANFMSEFFGDTHGRI